MELIGLYLMACGLLVVAGVAKARNPGQTARALAATVPVREGALRRAVRAGAVAEAALGTIALAYPRPLLAGAVALSYATFTLFVGFARARAGPLASCGCLGTPDTPATALHAVVDLVLCVSAAGVAAAAPAGSVLSTLAREPFHGLPLVVASAVGVWLTILVISVLAELAAARRLTAIYYQSGP